MSRWLTLGLLVVAALVSIGLLTGPFPIPAGEVWSILWNHPQNSQEAAAIWELRLPRLLLAALVGAALSCAGAAFQSLLRSPLADPYLTGTSAGASLGTALALVGGAPPPLQPIFAFVGSLAAVALVRRLARQGQSLRLEDFLLAGVMVSTLLGSLVTLVLTLAGQEMRHLVFFLLGNLAQSGWTAIQWSLPPFLVGLAVLIWHAYALNVLSLGEEVAAPAGVEVERVKSQVLLAASLLTGAAVSSAGLVGFVGLVIPHLCRLWCGPDLRRLLPLALVWGAGFLLACDLVARSCPQELPVGVVTALVGAPWFLYQLRSARARTA